jgi:hypothetical protein
LIDFQEPPAGLPDEKSPGAGHGANGIRENALLLRGLRWSPHVVRTFDARGHDRRSLVVT